MYLLKRTLLIAALVCSSGSGLILLTENALAVEMSSSGVDADLTVSRSAQLEMLNQQFAQGVVIPTYQALAEKTTGLAEAGAAFEQSPTEANLSNLKDAWLDVRLMWAQSNAFEFGPVHSLGYGSELTFPLDTSGLSLLLNQLSKAEAGDLTETRDVGASLASVSLHPSLKGLEAIAHILSYSESSQTDATQTPRNNSPRAASDFSLTERTYLSYLTAETQAAANGLLTVWQIGWNGYPAYSTVLASAGSPDNISYISKQAGAEEIVRSLFNSLDVVVSEELPGLIEASDELADNSLDLQILNSTLIGIRAVSQTAGFAELANGTNDQTQQQLQASLNTAIAQVAAAQSATAQSDRQNLTDVSLSLTTALRSLETAHTLLETDILLPLHL